MSWRPHEKQGLPSLKGSNKVPIPPLKHVTNILETNEKNRKSQQKTRKSQQTSRKHKDEPSGNFRYKKYGEKNQSQKIA